MRKQEGPKGYICQSCCADYQLPYTGLHLSVRLWICNLQGSSHGTCFGYPAATQLRQIVNRSCASTPPASSDFRTPSSSNVSSSLKRFTEFAPVLSQYLAISRRTNFLNRRPPKSLLCQFWSYFGGWNPLHTEGCEIIHDVILAWLPAVLVCSYPHPHPRHEHGRISLSTTVLCVADFC